MNANVTYRLGKLDALGLLHGEWLDCGCADGGYAIAIAQAGAQTVVGVDTLEERIVEARARARVCAHADTPVTFLHASAESLPFPNAWFDGVLMNEVLEHVTDEIKALREVYRVLRPGGHLVVMSPNRWFPFEGHGMRLGDKDLLLPVPFLPWLPSRIAQRLLRARNYWPHELRDLIRHIGFVIRVASFVLPVFEVFPWLPAPLIRRYRAWVPLLERLPVVRRFGVSNLIVAQKPLS